MKGFYVTLQRAKRTGWLLGPFAEHEDAKAAVKATFTKACEIDGFAAFDAVGTSSITRESMPPAGVLNHLLPELIAGKILEEA